MGKAIRVVTFRLVMFVIVMPFAVVADTLKAFGIALGHLVDALTGLAVRCFFDEKPQSVIEMLEQVAKENEPEDE